MGAEQHCKNEETAQAKVERIYKAQQEIVDAIEDYCGPISGDYHEEDMVERVVFTNATIMNLMRQVLKCDANALEIVLAEIEYQTAFPKWNNVGEIKTTTIE